MMLSYSSHGWSVGFSTDSTQNMGYAASLSALGNVNKSDSSTTQSAVGDNIQLTVNQGEVPTALSRDTQNANAKTERFDITEARERQEMAQVIGEIANNSVAIALKPRLDKAEQDKEEAQRRLDKNPNDAQAQAQLAQANTVIAQYGQGSDIQMAVRAVTGVLQGIATGNVGQAVVGGLSPYANKLIKEATTDQSGQVNKEANLMAHALLGAIEAYATGNHAGAGAAGAVTGELAAELIIKQLYDKDSPDELTEAQKQTVTALSQLASGLSGGLVGDSTSSAISAAEIGKRAVEDNYLETVWDITNLSIGGASLVYNISEGNYGYAIVDAAGLAYDAVAVFFPFLPAGASASLEAYRAGNTLKQSLVIGSDMVEATKIANKASKNLDNIVEGNARLTGSRIHRETGVLLGEKSGKAESLSELANSYFKGTNGYIGKQPDLSWRGSSVWADLTTAKQWHAHIRTYENSHGLGIPILYSPGKGVVNFPQLRTGGSATVLFGTSIPQLIPEDKENK